MYCIKGSTCDIVGTFRRPHSDSALGGIVPLFPPRYAPERTDCSYCSVLHLMR